MPGCDNPSNAKFNEPWVPGLIPPEDPSVSSEDPDNWSKCKTYGFIAAGYQAPGTCNVAVVDKGSTVGCPKRVFDDDMWTVVNQVLQIIF